MIKGVLGTSTGPRDVTGNIRQTCLANLYHHSPRLVSQTSNNHYHTNITTSTSATTSIHLSHLKHHYSQNGEGLKKKKIVGSVIGLTVCGEVVGVTTVFASSGYTASTLSTPLGLATLDTHTYHLPHQTPTNFRSPADHYTTICVSHFCIPPFFLCIYRLAFIYW